MGATMTQQHLPVIKYNIVFMTGLVQTHYLTRQVRFDLAAYLEQRTTNAYHAGNGPLAKAVRAPTECPQGIADKETERLIEIP